MKKNKNRNVEVSESTAESEEKGVEDVGATPSEDPAPEALEAPKALSGEDLKEEWLNATAAEASARYTLAQAEARRKAAESAIGARLAKAGKGATITLGGHKYRVRREEGVFTLSRVPETSEVDLDALGSG